MQFDDGRPRLGYRGSVTSRARDILLRTAAVIAGGVALVSAFVLSLAFFAIALAVVLIAGGYFWWKTRHVRQQMRAAMQEQMQMHREQPRGGDVIEGVVITREQTHENTRRPR